MANSKFEAVDYKRSALFFNSERESNKAIDRVQDFATTSKGRRQYAPPH
jgi:hypothetical protein